MQVFCDEGLAAHIGPELCGGFRHEADEKSVKFTTVSSSGQPKTNLPVRVVGTQDHVIVVLRKRIHPAVVVGGRAYVIAGGRTPGGSVSALNEIFMP